MDCLEVIQRKAGVLMPNEDDLDWCEFSRTEIMIRRHFLLEDALKEGHKRRFNPKKYLKVLFIQLAYQIFVSSLALNTSFIHSTFQHLCKRSL